MRSHLNQSFGFSQGLRKSAPALLAVLCLASAVPASAQTLIYDGSQPLNFYSGTDLTGPLMLNNNPADPTRNGIVQSGSDANVLEQGDAAWFRSTGRRMRSVTNPATINGMADQPVGLAGAAAGVDGSFMSPHFDTSVADGLDDISGDQNGVGASYVLYDNGVTTGPQLLTFRMYYNDPTPNLADGTNNGDGGIVAVRVQGVQGTGDAADPWGTDAFRHLASSGSSAAGISAGQHRDNSGEEAGPVVDNLLIENSNVGEGLLTPSADWQDVTIPFDLGTGYEYIIFSFAGVAQSVTAGPNVFAFDDISYEAAPFTAGDFDQDGNVDGTDFLDWQRDTNIGSLSDWQTNYGTTSGVASINAVPEPSSMLLAAMGFTLLARSSRRNRC